MAVRVAVALSGGVDSAVAALLLRQCAPHWRDLESLCGLTRPPPLACLMEAIKQSRPFSQIREMRGGGDQTAPFSNNSDGLCDPSAPVEYEPLFITSWDDADGDDLSSSSRCVSAEADYRDATDVARALQLLPRDRSLRVCDHRAEYVTRCFDPMLRAYAGGETLNVDVLCNAEVKFRALLDRLLASGASRLATGHYARTAAAPRRTAPVIARPFTAGADLNDQTVFLARLAPAQVGRAVFPIGHLFGRKSAVRAVAARFGLRQVASKKTSTGLCFVGNRRRRGLGGGFGAFLNAFIAEDAADTASLAAKEAATVFVDATTGGTLAETTPPMPAYALTLGQSIRLGSEGKMYVCGKEMFTPLVAEGVGGNGSEANHSRTRYLSTVQLVPQWDHPFLYSHYVTLRDVRLTASMHDMEKIQRKTSTGKTHVQMRCSCCTRHQEALRPAVLRFAVEDTVEASGQLCVPHAEVEFEEAVRAVTPGQVLVAYAPLGVGGPPSADWYVAASGWIVGKG